MLYKRIINKDVKILGDQNSRLVKNKTPNTKDNTQTKLTSKRKPQIAPNRRSTLKNKTKKKLAQAPQAGPFTVYEP